MRLRRVLWQIVGLAVAFAAILGALDFAADAEVLDRANLVVAAIVAACALALPWRAALVWVVCAGLVWLAAGFVNAGKISLTEMPLTYLDLRIAAANPSGFLGAMKISPFAVVGVAALVAIGAGALANWRLSHIRWAEARANVFPRAIAVALAAALAGLSMTQLSRRLETAIAGHEYADIANMPDGLLLISRKIGVVPFLALTARYDATSTSPFRRLAGEEAIAATGAAPDWLARGAARPGEQQPDIVVVLLESTFDLPRIFDVTPAMRSDFFPASGKGQLQGELGVDAIGGGTWISEFEAITGIPSRLFGYAGYYTHVALAPYVKASLATWLKQRGYRTLALYPVEGKFYGARAAYGHYGFDTYLDGVDLKIEKPWYAEDTDIVSRYIGVLQKTDTTRPLFAFALTMENHSPHPCTRFGSEAEMPYRFVGATNARGTCELNEYIARYRSTETAIAMLESALRDREKKTGRPYVLAVFGDHQPNSFTGTAKTPFWSPNDYSKLRRGPNDVTFYQIRSSAPSPFATSRLDASIVMLPTLVSAYVARDARDMYLPGNFAVLAGCGERIALPRLNAAYGNDAKLPERELAASGPARKLSGDCETALVAARDDYLRLIEMP
ncbi:MAG: LTA synthase family protein [Hyphomicrobiales bacterium]|nr:LTA synthase family protein [Hyphomicrobiales bacterium]